MSLVMCNIATSGNDNNNNSSNLGHHNDTEKNSVTIYRWVECWLLIFFLFAELIIDMVYSYPYPRCPIASLDCMEEFTGHTHIDYGKLPIMWFTNLWLGICQPLFFIGLTPSKYLLFSHENNLWETLDIFFNFFKVSYLIIPELSHKKFKNR
jgi:hypothetical protein